MVNLLFLSATLCKESFNLQKEKIAGAILVPIIYAICLYPENYADIQKLSGTFLEPMILFIIVALPLILLIVTKFKLRKKGGVKNEG
ncbi:MAG: spore gernimation protein, partial [Clostridium sp.]